MESIPNTTLVAKTLKIGHGSMIKLNNIVLLKECNNKMTLNYILLHSYVSLMLTIQQRSYII